MSTATLDAGGMVYSTLLTSICLSIALRSSEEPTQSSALLVAAQPYKVMPYLQGPIDLYQRGQPAKLL
jgi:hypothetical protein